MLSNENTAVPVPSVGADREQPISKTTTQSITECQWENNPQEESLEEIYRRIQRINDPGYLPTVTMNELYESIYESRPPIIDKLLYSGTYLMAGAPKVGKYFLVAQLAYHVSTGIKLWDYDVHQGTVLYLALEDDYQRLQGRMARMFGVDGTDKLHFSVFAKQLGNGLDEQLELFVKEHPDTRLVIIDTLQKIRGSGGDGYSYAEDYQNMGRLKQFADSKGLCLLLVHHTRKTSSGDKFEMISGTTGLLGCADGTFVLHKEQRTDRDAMLDIVGRDQPDQRLYLVRDEARLFWCLDHAGRELWKEPPDPLLEAVGKMITAENPTWQGSATELAGLLNLDIQPNAMTKRLNVQAGKLLNSYHIRYTNTHSRNGSRITLALEAGA